MPFSRALYYPFIDISDDAWLKTAMLYWREIRTIVPASMNDPYANRTTREFQDEGLVIPLRVEPSMPEIEGLVEDVTAYLESRETLRLVATGGTRQSFRIHRDSISRSLHRSDWYDDLVDMHPEKMSSQVRQMLEASGLTGDRENEWYRVDENFADYYMTLLARKLSETMGAELLTPLPEADGLSSLVRLGGPYGVDNPPRGARRHWARRLERLRGDSRRRVPHSVAEGILVDVILERVQIDADTPVSKIVDFRRRRNSELEEFRDHVKELSAAVGEEDTPLEALRESCRSIHDSKVAPALDKLKRSLKDDGIRWLTDHSLKMATLKTSSSAMFTVMGLSVPYALLAGAVASVAAGGVLFALDRKQRLEENPYSYVMAAGKEFK